MTSFPEDIRKKAEAVWLSMPEVGEDEDFVGLIAQALLDEREAERARCADFAHAKYDWPARWIAASLRGENDGYIRSPDTAQGTPA